jgi:hypothetical protein
MAGGYRIVVREIRSERFCRGFGDTSRRVRGRTAPEGGLGIDAVLRGVLARPADLGLDASGVAGAEGAGRGGREG